MTFVGIAVGLVMIWGGGAELHGWWRARRRIVRTDGVVIGRTEVLGQGPGSHSRAARFQFTTRNGQTVESTSQKYSYPGPKPGSHITVAYDPADPKGTAEVAGVRTFKLALSPLPIAGGATLAIYFATLL